MREAVEVAITPMREAQIVAPVAREAVVMATRAIEPMVMMALPD